MEPKTDTSARKPRGADVRTFLIADVRGYTRFTQEHGDEAASTLAARFADVVGNTVPEFDGELIELRGDEALSVFSSARQALRGAVELQRRLRTVVDGEPVLPLGVGIGLDAGEAVPVAGGYRGKALNLAARLCSLAKPGEILGSDTVRALAGQVDGIVYGKRRSVRVKGVGEPLGVITVETDEPLPPVPALGPAKQRWTWKRGALIIAALAGAAIAATVLALGGRQSPKSTLPVAYVKGVVAIDPTTNREAGFIRTGYQDSGYPLIAVGEGFAWIVTDYEVQKVSLRTARPIDRIRFADSDWAAAGEGALWVQEGTANLRQHLLFRLDPKSGEITGRFSSGDGDWITTGEGAVWLCSGGSIWKFATTGRVEAKVPVLCGGQTDSIIVAYHAVWAVASDANTIVRINPRTARVEAKIDVPQVERLSAGGGAISALSPNNATKTLTEINPATDRPVFTIPIRARPTPGSLAVGFNSLWVGQGTWVLRIDPIQGKVTSSSDVHGFPKQIVASGGRVWVSKLTY